MDNLFAIGLGLGLRALVDVYHDDDKVSGTLVGLWEGLVLGHLLHKHPGSTDPYFALVFRLICDLAVTESFVRVRRVRRRMQC
jgi:F0F1-type ATP synthase assembly protein I